VSELSFAEVGEILQLLQAVEGRDVDLEWGDLKIQVRRGGSGDPSHAGAVSVPAVAAKPSARVNPAEPITPAKDGESSSEHANGEEDARVYEDVPKHWMPVVAPLAGTFYRAPKPDDPPFVEVGDPVSSDDTVALVEVMKLFTELKAGASGKVARIDAPDQSLVEFGQALIWIEPA
jgi:acetyl-CoA carboxylase biotin carboxyl carrier protein